MDFWDVYAYLAFLLVSKFLLAIVYTILRIAYIYVFHNIFSQPKDLTKFGKWAVVTGSSNGIGKNYAKELAQKGMNVVLISNEEEKLQEVSQEIESSYNVETKVIFADFTLRGDDAYQKIFEVLKDLDVGILVNNVGTAKGLPNQLEKMTRQEMWDIMMVNVCAATSMAHYILPKMKRQRRGLIINIASLAGLCPTPYAALYGSSKAYIKSFSDALKWECHGTGVEIQTVCPSFVDTKIIQSRAEDTPKLFFPPPEKFVKSAISTVGKAGTTAGYVPHEIKFTFLEMLPQSIATWISYQMFNVKDFSERKTN